MKAKEVICAANYSCGYRKIGNGEFFCGYGCYCDFQLPRDSREIKIKLRKNAPRGWCKHTRQEVTPTVKPEYSWKMCPICGALKDVIKLTPQPKSKEE